MSERGAGLADESREPAAEQAARSAAAERGILAEAAEWFAVLQGEHVSEGDRRRWQAWLAADPAHARIWQRVKAISQPFAQAAQAAQGAPAQALRETLAHARASGRRRALRVLGLGGVVVGSGLLLRQALPWQAWLHGHALAHAGHRTGVGERRQLMLPDGTRLVLNTATAADVDFGRRWRRIVLHQGEILVDSAPDTQSPARPLVVDTPCARLTALGTRFTVRSEAGNPEGHSPRSDTFSDFFNGFVAVFEGAVRITLANGEQREVAAGQQARFTAEGIAPAGRAEQARESWSRGQLVADDIPLADFVAELSRYTAVPIALSPDAARLRLVGVYPIANPGRDVPAILIALESALPLRVQHTPAGGVLIAAR